MGEQAGRSQMDVNRGLRDRLGNARAGGTWDRQAAERNSAVNDLQDLARSRMAAASDERRC
jgi:hypothetical protein